MIQNLRPFLEALRAVIALKLVLFVFRFADFPRLFASHLVHSHEVTHQVSFVSERLEAFRAFDVLVLAVHQRNVAFKLTILAIFGSTNPALEFQLSRVDVSRVSLQCRWAV